MKWAIVALLICPGLAAAQSNLDWQLSVTAGEESNVTRGIDDFHEREATFGQLNLGIANRYQLGLHDALQLGANVIVTRFNELTGFDSEELIVTAGYSRKFGLGPYAPVLAVKGNIGQSNSQGEARDVWRHGLSAEFSQRYANGWSWRGSLDGQFLRSSSLPDQPILDTFGYDPELTLPFELFEYDSVSAGFAVDYEFVNGWLLWGDYRRVLGGTVASTTTPDLDVYKISRSFYTDPAFDSGWFAYGLEANTNQWQLGLSVPLLQDTSLDLGYSYMDIQAPEGRQYRNTIYAATFVHSF